MPRRHPNLPTAWLITDERIGPHLPEIAAAMPRGSGIIVRHQKLPPPERAILLRKLKRVTAGRGITILDETDGRVARVHSARQIARARLAGAELLFVSPLFGTRSHPEWKPLPRMRAAALARLAGPGAMALGGMDGRRFRLVERLGFTGWAGIDGWLDGRRRGPSRE